MSEKVDVEKTIKTYYEDVYKFCCAKCRNAEVAQDITQDTFLLFIQKSETLFNKNIRAWLLSVANNKLHDYFRKIKSDNNFVSISEIEIPVDDTYLFENLNITDSELFDKTQIKILNMLNEKERSLFIKIYIEKKKISLVSKELNTSEGNIRTRKSRLNKKVRDIIKHTDFLLLILYFKILH